MSGRCVDDIFLYIHCLFISHYSPINRKRDTKKKQHSNELIVYFIFKFFSSFVFFFNKKTLRNIEFVFVDSVWVLIFLINLYLFVIWIFLSLLSSCFILLLFHLILQMKTEWLSTVFEMSRIK